MVYQLRQYQIHSGQMDRWMGIFNEHIRPLHERLGIPIIGSWQSEGQKSFIWIRAFDSAGAIERKEADYFSAPERQALGDLPQTLIASMAITVMTHTDQAHLPA
ncbi:MAG: NIPSNAP family protein [Pseudomonadales bacterium]